MAGNTQKESDQAISLHKVLLCVRHDANIHSKLDFPCLCCSAKDFICFVICVRRGDVMILPGHFPFVCFPP